MTSVAVKADFLADVKEQLSKRLQLSGVTIPAGADVDTVSMRYFDYKHRYLPARPRRVLRSRELGQQVLAPDHQAGLDAIVEDAEAGRTLWPYFSKTFMNLDLRDPLYDDWHIRHLHLGGRTVDSNGFVKRTGPVLFSYITLDTVYVLDVGEHDTKVDPTAFAKKRLIQIMVDNWPEVIAYAKMEGFSNIEPNDDESRSLLTRKRKGCNVLLGVGVEDGTVYGLIGRGLLGIRMASDALLNDAHRLQEWATSEAPRFCRDIELRVGETLEELHLRLEIKHVMRGVEYGFRETQTGLMLFSRTRRSFPEKPA